MIEIRGLVKTFHARQPDEVRALRGVDLSVPEGQFVTLIGTNGCGKSTLLNAVAGSFLPDEGEIRIGGRDVSRAPEHARAQGIGRVFQNPFQGTVADMTVAENLHLASLRGRPRSLRTGLDHRTRTHYRETVRRLEMGLEDRMEALIGTLSGGQRQALTLLMAVLVRPGVLLLDEHTAALDPRSADQVMRLSEAFIREGRLTALMVTHDMAQALRHGDRTVMMHQGRVVADLPGSVRAGLAEADLVDLFAEQRHRERLTPAHVDAFRKQYQPSA